jgi:5-methyltetrahydrofolate--homocysteine methyltransferase
VNRGEFPIWRLRDFQPPVHYPQARIPTTQMPTIGACSPSKVPMTTDFLQTLQEGRFLLDGAIGTSLMNLGLKSETLAMATLERPAAVAEVHRGFLQAGSRWIQTNTFAANKLALQGSGASVSALDLNRAAAQLARAEVHSHGSGWVAGNVGPAGNWADPVGSAGRALLESVYVEQATGLIEGDVDLLSLETFGDATEACIALKALRSCTDLPILVSFTFEERDGEFVTLREEALLEALLRVQDAGADAVGVNCASGSTETLACIHSIAPHIRVPFTAKPNAGVPVEGPDGLSFPQSPEAFARDMTAAIGAGASAVGGCCGADARFIQALRSALDQRSDS